MIASTPVTKQGQPCRSFGMDLNNPPLAIDMDQLAVLIGARLRSLRNAFYLRPQDFPPAIDIPGCRGVRFLMADVLVWLETRKTQTAPAPEPARRPRGRPRIAQQQRGRP